MSELNAYASILMTKVPALPSLDAALWGLVLIIGLLLASRISLRVQSRRRAFRTKHYQGRTLAAPTAAPNTAATLSHATLSFPLKPSRHDPKQQMEAIAPAEFEVTPLRNREEARLLPLLESCAAKLNNGYRVMAQTSLGEIIRPKQAGLSQDQQRAAYASINFKRLDFAIFDRFGRLRLAIEYQGSGHYQAKTFMRDAVKREVLRKAGVPFIEVPHDFSHDETTRQITLLLVPPEHGHTVHIPAGQR